MRDACTEIRDLAMIDFLSSTGVRVGELVKLDKVDVNMQERSCVVLGKGGKEKRSLLSMQELKFTYKIT